MAKNENVEAARSYEFYFGDFEIGRTLQMGAYTITEEEILTFILQYDPQPFHIDAEATEHSICGGIISDGRMTCSIMMRLMVTSLLGKAAGMNSPGVDEIRQTRPAYPKDTLSVSSTRMKVCPPQSKPDRGVAVNRQETRNQHGGLVYTVTSMGLSGRRPKA